MEVLNLLPLIIIFGMRQQMTCSTSGVLADMSITYEMIPTFDAYGGTAVHTTNGTNYKVEYSGNWS